MKTPQVTNQKKHNSVQILFTTSLKEFDLNYTLIIRSKYTISSNEKYIFLKFIVVINAQNRL